MDIVFIAGLPCSGKSYFTTRLVEHLGDDRAVRVPMDHYYQDGTRPEHFEQSSMEGCQRERIDWALLHHHLEDLRNGHAFDTPRYDWETLKRVPSNSGIGRTRHVRPVPLVFVDGLHPSLYPTHKHIQLDPSWEIRKELIRIRATQMPLRSDYESILRQVEQSSYAKALSWLTDHRWKVVGNPFAVKLEKFCHACGWDNIIEPEAT
jgi:hypothetical protein